LRRAIVKAVEQGGLSFLDAQHVATLRRLIGEAKAPAYLELIAEELAAGKDKVVIMGIHTRALAIIAEGLRARGFPGVELVGSTPEAQRVANVMAFQQDPNVRWLIGNLRAAGTGHTLTAACDIDLFESSWAPADNAQALMRVHRIGQERTVHARFISLSGSLDEVVSETVARKTAAIAMVEGVAETAIDRAANIF
jgi:SWI/SNF-related matrix-associated actin-dependent regulator 1 of chromatin subfamily A